MTSRPPVDNCGISGKADPKDKVFTTETQRTQSVNRRELRLLLYILAVQRSVVSFFVFLYSSSFVVNIFFPCHSLWFSYRLPARGTLSAEFVIVCTLGEDVVFI